MLSRREFMFRITHARFWPANALMYDRRLSCRPWRPPRARMSASAEHLVDCCASSRGVSGVLVSGLVDAEAWGRSHFLRPTYGSSADSGDVGKASSAGGQTLRCRFLAVGVFLSRRCLESVVEVVEWYPRDHSPGVGGLCIRSVNHLMRLTGNHAGTRNYVRSEFSCCWWKLKSFTGVGEGTELGVYCTRGANFSVTSNQSMRGSTCCWSFWGLSRISFREMQEEGAAVA